ncbi:uncharacterized protein TRAVEDRAFT_21449 [Trametes versicolor FP-101664 SS1]|uniref:uncharacterized protein n=1 Tax=Trametes versicolor (strain FP-101664) TaxID=717944 RepID=UPI0004623B59|nr:uncharacterized protein TRAVEDRAFT_21449 [Trametes versicolor FP-101664 SS1]EIW58020.1 hypothetical protein TRAVEDRAFT_21449 [Trametes versicolor FP-101664 SS1]
MAEPTPTSNNKTANPSDRNPTLQDPSDSTNGEGGYVILLLPPFHASNIQRRAADVMRRRLQWSEGSPPGIYWNGDDNPYQPFLLKDVQEDDARDNTAGSSGVQDPAVTSITTQGFESTLDDSSDSGSSAPASPLTPTSSDLSTPPETPFKTSRFSGTTRRRGTGASQDDSDDEVQGQLIELGAENIHVVRRQFYMMKLFESDGKCKETVLKMNIDTGSNDTWILGEDHCQIEILEKRRRSGLPSKIRLRKWPLNNQPSRHHTLKPNPFARNPGDLGEILQEPGLPPRIAYSDKSLVLIEQLTEPLTFRVKNFYNWNSSLRRNAPHTFGYRFAVAYAVNDQIMRDPADGIVGLGPLRRQQAFEPTAAEKDFSSVLTEQCVALEGETEDDTYNGGHVHCFALRPAWVDKRIDPSWWSINKVPGDIDFSEKIPVRERPSRRKESPGIRDWAVDMLSMEFYQLVLQRDDAGVPQRRRVLLGRVDFTEREEGELGTGGTGVLFILDTGASTTDLPPVAFEHIQKNIFPAANVGRTKSSLRIPPAYCSDDSVVVDFVFRGENDAPVTVTGPGMPFLCQGPDGKGLLFPYRGLGGYVLGVNFFHTMFVAMHRPGNSLLHGPYVRLAPQWPQERYRLRLPPREHDQNSDGEDTQMEATEGVEPMEVDGEPM